MSTVQIPVAQFEKYNELFDYALSPELTRLRSYALERHGTDSVYAAPTVPIIDAETWSTHTDDEDWLIWRARRTAERLRRMPLHILPGEKIVGRPDLRPRTTDEERTLSSLQHVADSIPPFPGGDPGHFQPDFEKLLQVGIGGILDEIDRMRSVNADAGVFYDACTLALLGMSDYIKRVSGESGMPEISKLAYQPPKTFHEAVELIFLTIIALWFGEDHGLTCPGRLDRLLLRFYEADMEAGRITMTEALELICNLYINLNVILHPGSAIAVMVGGRNTDGKAVENDLTYLCLIARKATRLVYPTVGLAWHDDTSEELMDFACRMISTGIGDPALFNDEIIAHGLRDHGVSVPDSYNYMNSTCVEIKPVGASHIWVTAPYFNCPKAILDVIDRSVEGTLPMPASFEELNTLVKNELSDTVAQAAGKLDQIWKQRGVTGCFPLASCFISDCIERGVDFDRGGARYNWVENSFVGLANLVDSLVAIRHYVYERKDLTLQELRDVLGGDFADNEELRARIEAELPKYGNDAEDVDTLAVEWAHYLSEITENLTVGLHRYVPGFFCWIVHEKFGAETGATPDGRHAGFPLADGAGAAQGRERSGPTASILSTTKWNHRRVMGGLVHNLKLSKNVLRGGLGAVKALLETYMRRGGFEIQVNVVSADELRDAQDHPEDYRDLLVRVAGYSDYFVHLNRNMQEEVIKRTEHVI